MKLLMALKFVFLLYECPRFLYYDRKINDTKSRDQAQNIA